MKIAVLTSGGVDSSVALRLLKDQGHDVTAFYIKVWLEDELTFLGTCPWEEDLSYVQQICSSLAVPLEICSLQREYFDRVVSYTLEEAKAGRTPNPDVFCNSRIKFGSFLEKLPADFTFVATGHYARTKTKGGLTYLKMSADPVKDQTYFLANIRQDQISRLIFPVGGLLKSEVRELASQYDLPNKNRKDSQGICFLGKIEFRDFLKSNLGVRRGDFVEFETNKKIGEHDGYWFYTIGQRRGIPFSGGPWYVVKKDMDSNTVFISREHSAATGTTHVFNVPSCNWISGKVPSLEKTSFGVRIRHGGKIHPCRVSSDQNGLHVEMGSDEYIAPGQFAVFYSEDYCLGGGAMTLV